MVSGLVSLFIFLLSPCADLRPRRWAGATFMPPCTTAFAAVVLSCCNPYLNPAETADGFGAVRAHAMPMMTRVTQRAAPCLRRAWVMVARRPSAPRTRSPGSSTSRREPTTVRLAASFATVCQSCCTHARTAAFRDAAHVHALRVAAILQHLLGQLAICNGQSSTLHPASCCGELGIYGCNVHAACTRHGQASGTRLKRCAMSTPAPARSV